MFYFVFTEIKLALHFKKFSLAPHCLRIVYCLCSYRRYAD
ncbi:hypothetical protein HMPREF0262_00984 [Clostridium sp. ATCC 29733]|nr:hypothetical protein HMPREF0262_00984 [Clostridium sp. ATCC 29733]